MTPERELANQIAGKLRDAGHRSLLAGGSVRDMILGNTPKDYDIATSARPEEVQKLFEKTVAVGAAFGVIMVLPDGKTPFEVATFRKDIGYSDGRHPDAVSFTDEREDALRRDFTINGLFMDPETDEIFDYVEGRADIERRVIRAIGDAGKRIAEDRLRMLRAVRFSARFQFAIERATFAAVKTHAASIDQVSAERIRDELVKMLTVGDPPVALELLYQSGLLEHILPEAIAMRGVEQPPEFHPEGDVWDHTLLLLARLDNATPTLAMAALLHDIGKPPTIEYADRIRFNNHPQVGADMSVKILERLKFSNHEKQRIYELVRDHLKFINVKQMKKSTLTRFLRMDGFDEHLALHRLDCLASHGFLDLYHFCKETLAELGPEKLKPPRLVTGRDLIEMGLAPGPLFAKILREIEDAQLEGDLVSREQALARVKEQHLSP